jgi:hypothetical protein
MKRWTLLAALIVSAVVQQSLLPSQAVASKPEVALDVMGRKEVSVSASSEGEALAMAERQRWTSASGSGWRPE